MDDFGGVTLVPVGGTGPEDVLVDPAGRVYAGLADGRIVRVDGPGAPAETVARTPGRPLGLEFLGPDELLVCASDAGLLAVTLDGGRVRTLTDRVAGHRLLACNNAAVDADGTVTELLGGLEFANGVALAADGSFVAVAETGARRVHRVWLTGARAGGSEVFVDGLNGYPDNIALGSDGLVWVALPSPRAALLTGIQRLPSGVRALASRVPERMQPRPAPTVSVLAVDNGGRIMRELRGEIAGFRMLTAVREAGGVLWFGSLQGDSVATLRLDQSAGAVP